MYTELQLKLVEVYRELITLIDNMYGEHRKGWSTTDIAKAILAVKQNRFSDEELEPEYDNMLALRNYILKRNILGETWKFRIKILKVPGVARTVVILDKGAGEDKQVEIRMTPNIDRLQFGSGLVNYIPNFKTDTRVNLYIKSVKQLHLDYRLIESALCEGLLKIYEDGILMDAIDVFNKLEEFIWIS